MNYWTDKINLTKKAKTHFINMEQSYKNEIDTCVEDTVIYQNTENCANMSTYNTNIIIEDSTSVEAVQKYTPLFTPNHKTCVLNFASYKNAGGKFLEGSSAQEESLCHNSILYNVLLKIPNYYETNRKMLNRALYLNRAAYTPNVVFPIDGHEWKADVITCAAPNKTAAQKYQKVTDEENYQVLKSRIDFVLSIAATNSPDSLILGAYGCGVFGQDPIEVASIFKELLCSKYRGVFPLVVFPIPDKSSVNYQSFNKVFQ